MEQRVDVARQGMHRRLWRQLAEAFFKEPATAITLRVATEISLAIPFDAAQPACKVNLVEIADHCGVSLPAVRLALLHLQDLGVLRFREDGHDVEVTFQLA